MAKFVSGPNDTFYNIEKIEQIYSPGFSDSDGVQKWFVYIVINNVEIELKFKTEEAANTFFTEVTGV